MADPQAVLKTNRGDIVLNLFPNHAPETVANFTGLATGEKDYDAGNGRSGPFYDGLGFHRVISGFMIQGGCPLGTGTGGPGWSPTRLRATSSTRSAPPRPAPATARSSPWSSRPWRSARREPASDPRAGRAGLLPAPRPGVPHPLPAL